MARPDRQTNSPESRLSSNGVGGSTLPATAAFPASGKPKKRKPIPVKVQVAVAIRQANKSAYYDGGLGVRCPLCSLVLTSDEPRILEHMTPHATMVALGKDPDAIDNLRFVHAECAHRKTYGTKATTAGSDVHAIAKGVRFDKINRGERSRTRKGPPLKSRPFQKVHRPMRRPT